MNAETLNLLAAIRWNPEGLVCAIAQDYLSHQVLMQAWMSADSLQLSLQEGRAVYFSRSRHRLWRKGEESGHIQRLHEIKLDCDGDCLLLLVEQQGGIACHTGRASCFYRSWQQQQWQEILPVLQPSEQIYGHS